MPGIWPLGNVRAILNKPDDDKPAQMKAKPIVWWTITINRVILTPWLFMTPGIMWTDVHLSQAI